MVTNLKNSNSRYRYRFVFIVAALTTLLMLLPFLIYDKGFFLYCGDFNSQQIPFTMHISRWFHTGLGEYSFDIDLGSSFVNAYSFYTLGSPFAMILMLFPEAAIPYLMAVMLCIKFATAALTAYIFIGRYIKNSGYAVCAALLYAFSGFSIYNIFFNHFLDAVALFPLVLFALDEFFYEDRKGLFAPLIAINLINNYFFFTGQVVFIIIYFIAKLITKEYHLTLRRFVFMAIETIIGLLMGLLLALPAFVSLLDNPRSINYSYGFNLLLHGTSQQYAAIISSLFLPPDPPYLPNLFTDGVIKWTSLSAYLPLFSVAGVLTYFRTKGSSFIKIILPVCLVMALVPVLNSAFYTLNSSYYARWFYMPLLIMALSTGKMLEFNTKRFASSVLIVGGITFAYSFFGLVPNKVDGNTVIGLASNKAILFWLTLITAIIGLSVVYLWLSKFKGKPHGAKILMSFICVFSIVYGVIHIATGKIPQLTNDSSYKMLNYDAMALDILAEDESFYRVDSYDAPDNNSIFMDMNGVQTFNSVVSPSILEFYPSIGVKRDVSSKPEWSNFALRPLLSVKYLMVPLESEDEFKTDNLTYGFTHYNNVGPYSIYKNDLYLPMGIVFNEFITTQDFESVQESQRSNLLLKGIVLTDDQIAKYSDYFTETPANELTLLSYDDMVVDVNSLTTAENFVDTGNGFTASVTVEDTSMVMFSVPYDKGFKAFVDGEITEIENVNNGLSAILVSPGQHEIIFEYSTPFLSLSKLLCFIGIVLYLIYFLLDRLGCLDHNSNKADCSYQKLDIEL